MSITVAMVVLKNPFTNERIYFERMLFIPLLALQTLGKSLKRTTEAVLEVHVGGQHLTK